MENRKTFWVGTGVLLLEVGLFISMMKVARPLKEIPSAYFVLVVVLAVCSLLLIKWSQKAKTDLATVIPALSAGMIWWTLSEINVDVFKGAGIEDQAGFILLGIVFLVLRSCWKDINRSSKIAIGTFMYNWCAHMVIKLLMYFRNPIDPRVCLDAMNIFNILGFAYGILSIVGIIYIAIKISTKGIDKEKAPFRSMLMYVLILNILYIFVKGYFLLW